MKRVTPAALAVALLVTSLAATAPAPRPITSDPHTAAAALVRASATLDRFFRTHTLPELVISSVGTGLAPGGVAIDYATKTSTNTDALLQYDKSLAGVSLELEVSVGWTPSRTADMTVAVTADAATIEVWPTGYLPSSGPLPAIAHQVDQVTGPAVGRLAHYLDHLTPFGPFPRGGNACPLPLFYGTNPRITFHTPHHVVVFQYIDECAQFRVSVDGQHRPTLLAPYTPNGVTQLVMTTLLHLVP